LPASSTRGPSRTDIYTYGGEREPEEFDEEEEEAEYRAPFRAQLDLLRRGRAQRYGMQLYIR
jgi:hypothetical protein